MFSLAGRRILAENSLLFFLIIFHHRTFMRKMSKFFAANNKNLRSLIEQLAKRDIESTNLKIHAVITQQKGDKYAHRHIKTEQIDSSLQIDGPTTQDSPSRSHSRLHERRNKQNATVFSQFASKRTATTEKKKASVVRPYPNNEIDGKHIVRGDSVQKKYMLQKPHPNLFRVSKRSSIQNGFSLEEPQLSRKSSHNANLTVIQQIRMPSKPSKENIPIPMMRSHKNNAFFKE